MNKKVLLTATVQSHIAQFHKPLAKMLHDNGYEVHVAAKNNLAEKNGLEIDFAEKVFVIDSYNATIGEGILVRYALLLKDQGLSAKEIVGILEASKEQIHTLGVLDTLEYLKKGGRISAATAFLGSAMAIKPVVAVSEGEIIMLGKARGSKNGNNFLMKEIEKADGIDFTRPFCLGYTGLSDEMLQKYIKDSEALWSGHTDQLPVCSLGATIGTHVGPGAIAVAFFSPQS